MHGHMATHTQPASRQASTTNAAPANPTHLPTDRGSSRKRVPRAAAGDRTPGEPDTAAVCHAVPCHTMPGKDVWEQRERCSLTCTASAPFPLGSADRSPSQEQLIRERVFGRVPVPLTHATTSTLPSRPGSPAPTHDARPPHPPPPLPSPITSGFSLALCLALFFLFLFFFFPPNLVSIETRLAEGEIKQPHVTQIPTLKNLLVALVWALHNQESARARLGGLGLPRGTGLGWGDQAQMGGLCSDEEGPGSAAEGPPGRRKQCLGLTSAGFGLSVVPLIQQHATKPHRHPQRMLQAPATLHSPALISVPIQKERKQR